MIVRALLFAGLCGILWGTVRLYAQHKAAAVAAQPPPPPQGPVRPLEVLGRKSLYDVLIANGLSAEQAMSLSQSLGKNLNVRRLDPEDRYHVVRSSSGALEHLVLIHGLTRYVVEPVSARRAKTTVSRLPLAAESRQASGAVQGSLWVSMESVGVPAEIVFHFADAFQWTVDFLTEPRNGDKFAVVWTERKTPDGRVWDRRVEAGSYRGDVTGKRVAILFDGEYYDEDGESLRRMFLRAPLRFSRISSSFARNRHHPILRINRPHYGTDYAAPRGTPVSNVAEAGAIAARRQGG